MKNWTLSGWSGKVRRYLWNSFIHLFIHGTEIMLARESNLIPPKVNPKPTRIWAQADYVGGAFRKHSERGRKVKKANQGKEKKYNKAGGNTQAPVTGTQAEIPGDLLWNHVDVPWNHPIRGYRSCAIYPVSPICHWLRVVHPPGPASYPGGETRETGRAAVARGWRWEAAYCSCQWIHVSRHGQRIRCNEAASKEEWAHARHRRSVA